jgi:hypothetical protein
MQASCFAPENSSYMTGQYQKETYMSEPEQGRLLAHGTSALLML